MPITGLMMQAVRNGGAVAPVVTAGSSAIDPETLSPLFSWDLTRTTSFTDLGASTPATPGTVVQYVTDRGSGGQFLRYDASHAGPTLRQDAGNGNKKYLEFPGRLVTNAITQALPITRVTLMRIVTPTLGKIIWSGRGSNYTTALVTNVSTATLMEQFNGTGGNGNSTAYVANTWYVVTEVFDTNTSLQIDNGTTSTSARGTQVFTAEAISLGAGPDAGITSLAIDIMAATWFAGTLSAGNLAGVKTFYGAYVGKTL